MQTDIDTHRITRREALRQRRRNRPTRITIPKNVSPHVRLVFAEMGRQRMTYDCAEEKSGILRTTIKAWRHRNKPGIDSLAAVLGALGWDFVPIPRAKVLPKPLVADLEKVAAAHGLETSATIEALIAHVAQIHERFPLPDTAPPTAASIDDMVGGTDVQAA